MCESWCGMFDYVHPCTPTPESTRSRDARTTSSATRVSTCTRTTRTTHNNSTDNAPSSTADHDYDKATETPSSTVADHYDNSSAYYDHHQRATSRRWLQRQRVRGR
jgi:hypothetical protein